MSGRFFDTNVLMYIASPDQAKADRADTLMNEGGMTNVQVLNEITNVARRKMHMTWPQTHDFLAAVRTCLFVYPVTVATHEAGLEIAEYYRLSLYDSMIVAAALQADCDTLWSEDMHDGLLVADRLRVINPFRE